MSYSNVKNAKVDEVNKDQLDAASKTMVLNDSRLLPQSGIKPSIWCCYWYNTVLNSTNRSNYCYSKGDAVWMNTEDLEEFTINNKDYICSIAEKNGHLRTLLMNAKDGGESELIQFLMKVVSGEVTGNSMGYPLYCIGDIKNKTKIRVSLSDDNDQLPTNDQYWKDFFVDTSDTRFSEELISVFYDLLSGYVQTHLQTYHLSGIQEWWKQENNGISQSLSSQYLLKDFSNLKGYQEYSPVPGMVDSGFDYVVYYQHKVFDDQKTCKWFRVWKSGFLEHGGIVKFDEAWAATMGDSLVYRSSCSMDQPMCYKVNLAWNYTAGQTAPTYSYPAALTGFYYDDNAIDFGDGCNIQLEDQGLQLDPELRYAVQVTPFLKNGETPYQTLHTSTKSAKWYMTREVNTICNNSFRFVLDPDIMYYSYKVSGFSSNASQGF